VGRIVEVEKHPDADRRVGLFYSIRMHCRHIKNGMCRHWVRLSSLPQHRPQPRAACDQLLPLCCSLYVEKVECGEAEPRTIISGLVDFVSLDQMQVRSMMDTSTR
jgi:Putative tRNA binding domain